MIFTCNDSELRHTLSGTPLYDSLSDMRRLRARIYPDNSNVTSLQVKFDNYENGIIKSFVNPLDNFSRPAIDPDLWYSQDLPLDKNEADNRRQIIDGQLELFAATTGTAGNLSTNTSTIYLQEAYATDFIQAEVTMTSQSQITGTSRGQVRVEGAFFNYKYNAGDPGYSGVDGEVYAYARIDENADGTFRPHAYILQCDDAQCNSVTTELYNQDFTCSVQHDIPVTLSVKKEGSTLIFNCNNSVLTKTMNSTFHDSLSDMRRLRARIYPDNSSITSLQVKFDNYTTGETKRGETSFIINYVPALSASIAANNSVPTVESAGQIWMDRNLGASQVATNPTDSAAYGDLYQWGRLTDGHEKRTSATTSTLSTTDVPGHDDFVLGLNLPYDWRTPQKDTLWQGASGTNNPCPSGFRLPTITELSTEQLSWTSNNSAGAFASPLKLVMAGLHYFNTGALIEAGNTGAYWSSTSVEYSSYYLPFNSTNAGVDFWWRANGFSVRCIQD